MPNSCIMIPSAHTCAHVSLFGRSCPGLKGLDSRSKPLDTLLLHEAPKEVSGMFKEKGSLLIPTAEQKPTWNEPIILKCTAVLVPELLTE